MTLTAGIILIGDELLSGRVADLNLTHIAKELSGRGIPVEECRIIPDQEDVIIETVNSFRRQYTYVFTTGGIGPTHDDVTTASIAKAFEVQVYRDAETVKQFKAYFGDRATEATYRMCDFPVGAHLIENSASVAPGYRVENVFVLAGIPKIMRVMLDVALPMLGQSAPIQEISFTAHTTEGKLSLKLGDIQKAYPQVKIGSYPFTKEGKPTVSLVARSVEAAPLQDVAKALGVLLAEVEAEVIQAPDKWPDA